ncbi:pyridoxamine 5'-phosphate oxidase family protein (plasmid) [Embleya sp. NBC_00888]|nr:pyridoxamine 5'-phosphate oxidase family protein [Embleya sp. NBC_00888]
MVPERVSASGGADVSGRELAEMTEEESFAHVALQQVGRISMINAPIPFILPVNYKPVGNDIEFSTAADSMTARPSGPVHFEVDEVINAASIGWSSLFFGTAEWVRPREESGDSVAWPPNHREIRIRIRIRPYRVAGRRVRPVMAPR